MGDETPVMSLAGIVLRLSERVERLERRLDGHERDHEREADRAYHERMEALEYDDD